jgi:hypothetical protein
MTAKFLNKTLEDNLLCNICNEELKINESICLICNPTKHVFCYDCIYNWYKELNLKSNHYHNNYSIKTMCPICRKNGGLLPVFKNYKLIKNVHFKKKVPIIICGSKLKLKDGYCSFIGKSCYGGLCGKHYNHNNTIINTINNDNSKDISKENITEDITEDIKENI